MGPIRPRIGFGHEPAVTIGVGDVGFVYTDLRMHILYGSNPLNLGMSVRLVQFLHNVYREDYSKRPIPASGDTRE